MRVIPETASRKDWPRLVAQAINELIRKSDVETDAITRAENEVKKTFGDTISVKEKGKTLGKFGRNLAVGTSFETVAEFQGSVANETYATTNVIHSIASTSASDTTQTIVIEGHTIDGSGNLTFVAQEAALNGQTAVTLTTAMARANRAYVKQSGTFGTTPADLVGVVTVYDDTDGTSGGEPTTDAAAYIKIQAGDTQSNKCATSISSTDYWLIQTFDAGVGNSGGSANRVTVRMEKRDVANGGAWVPMRGEMVVDVGSTHTPIMFTALQIVPKNHDFRVRAKTDSNTAEVFATVSGVLAAITS